MNARWNVDGAQLVAMRRALSMTPGDVAWRMKTETRIVLGVEKGYRRFATREEAMAFVAKYRNVCEAIKKEREVLAPKPALPQAKEAEA